MVLHSQENDDPSFAGFFWPKEQNSLVNHGFDPKRYPDPAMMTRQLHSWNMHFMVTFWPGVDGALRQQLGNVTPPALIGSVCDQYNPRGRELYYDCTSKPY
eukprot:SAG31_NODE_1627_length_7705_cov_5.310939_2_plen_101_part_00